MPKNKTRCFPIYCCKKVMWFDEHDFTADGRLSFHCQKHGDKDVIAYLTWRGGLTEAELQHARKKKEDDNVSKTTTR